MDEMRKVFEAWAQEYGWDIDKIGSGEEWDGTYRSAAVRFMWGAWKAACTVEREVCAEVCETTVWSKDVTWWMEATKTQVSAEAGQQCADAIRARSQA